MCELTQAGWPNVPQMDMVSFGALVQAHNRALAQQEQRLFYNTRMAFHADEKAAKKWVKQWDSSPEDTVRRNKKMLIRTLGGQG